MQEEKRVRFLHSDLRYKRYKTKHKFCSSAVMFLLRDNSGSIDKEKKYLARTLMFFIKRFIEKKYSKFEIVWLTYNDKASDELTEYDFFHKDSSGGTFISSGMFKCVEIINDRYDPEFWNIYIMNATDGDNMDSDNQKAVQVFEQLSDICTLIGYIQVKAPNDYASVNFKNILEKAKLEKVGIAEIKTKNDVAAAFKFIIDQEAK